MVAAAASAVTATLPAQQPQQSMALNQQNMSHLEQQLQEHNLFLQQLQQQHPHLYQQLNVLNSNSSSGSSSNPPSASSGSGSTQTQVHIHRHRVLPSS